MTDRVRTRPTTRAEVLRYFRAWYDAARETDDLGDDGPITSETTIAKWRGVMDLVEFDRLAPELAALFGMAYDAQAWREALTPEREKRLRDLCDFIAGRATVPAAEPVQILGVRCRKAGVFLAVRGLLRDAGVDVSDVRPSTPLESCAKRGLPDVYPVLLRMSPSLFAVLRVDCRRDVVHLVLAAVLLFSLPLLGVLMFRAPWPCVPLFIAVFAAFLAIWKHSERYVSRPPRWVRFDGLRTFRDLCEFSTAHR